MGYDSQADTFRHIADVRGLMIGVAFELLGRGHLHDRSKLTEPERSLFDEYTPKLRETTYGSDEYKQHLEGMGEALTHHYVYNDHHPEHFEDRVGGMDLIQLTEMLCDWMAATRRHNDGDIRRSIEQNAERFGYGEEIKRLLLNTVARLEEVDVGP